MINDYRNSLMQDAARLGDYQSMSKNELANGYCDADENNDEDLVSAYWSAIMLRYWHWIYRWKDNSASLHVDDDTLVCWLNDAIRDAFNYRSWRKTRRDSYAEADLREQGIKKKVWIENPQYVHDENAADKSINFFLGAKRGKEYQAYNKDKRKSNVLTYSLDGMVDENGDCSLDYTGAVEKQYQISGASCLVEHFLKENKNIEALVIDGIVNGDSFKENKTSEYVTEINEETGEEEKEKIYHYSSNFDPRKLVKHLNEIDEAFIVNYFCGTYDIDEAKGKTILAQLKKCTNGKLYNYIKLTLERIKQTPELLDYLR